MPASEEPQSITQPEPELVADLVADVVVDQPLQRAADVRNNDEVEPAQDDDEESSDELPALD